MLSKKVRYWHRANKLTGPKVRCEREADIAVKVITSPPQKNVLKSKGTL